MTRLIYDGTFEGLLTAVFEIYDRKLDHINLQKCGDVTAGLFENVLTITTDETRANRVLKGLQSKLSIEGFQRVYIAHLGELEDEDNNIVGFIRYVFDSAFNVEEDYGNRYVLRLSEIIVKMRRERHRMEAFIRFQKLQDGMFYAHIEPDFNVLPLLVKHFKDRYADQKWLIYDVRRSYGLYYDLHNTEFVSMDHEAVKPAQIAAAHNDDEWSYQHLWKNYFNSVNIASRKNTKLHVRHIPKRYWKLLTEKL